MIDLYNEELVAAGGYRCKDCSKMVHEHTFNGKQVVTGGKDKWGYEEYKWVYDSACDENFRTSRSWRSEIAYPNLMRIDGKWYHMSSRARILSIISKADIYLTVESRESLVKPQPEAIVTYGDMYNFCVSQNILDKLKLVTDADTFKSMQSKSIARSLKKMSA